MIMKKYITIIATMLLLMTSCTPNKISDEQLNGGYIVTSSFNISSMTFDKDNDHYFKWDMSVMSGKVITGHYAISGDEIHVMGSHKIDGVLVFKIGSYVEETKEGATLKKLHLDWVMDGETTPFELLGIKHEE
jgi:hypothetical protein